MLKIGSLGGGGMSSGGKVRVWLERGKVTAGKLSIETEGCMCRKEEKLSQSEKKGEVGRGRAC